MTEPTENRLINQGQFRNLGNHFEDWYVNRDTKNLKEAIQILQEKLDKINDKFNKKAVKSAQDNAQRSSNMDKADFNSLLSQMGNADKATFQAAANIINGKRPVPTDDGPKHDDAKDSTKGTASSSSHDDKSSETNDKSDTAKESGPASHHDDSSNSKDKDDNQTSREDLNFLNHINKH